MSGILLLLVLVAACQESNFKKAAPQTNSSVSDEYLSVQGPIDLLDVVVDLNVKISSETLLFSTGASSVDVGDHSSCEINIQQGDIYRYSFEGDGLKLIYPNGQNLFFSRITGEQGELRGVWRNERRIKNQLIKTRISILNDERLILRTHCEA
jgi:hypothetical protein